MRLCEVNISPAFDFYWKDTFQFGIFLCGRFYLPIMTKILCKSTLILSAFISCPEAETEEDIPATLNAHKQPSINTLDVGLLIWNTKKDKTTKSDLENPAEWAFYYDRSLIWRTTAWLHFTSSEKYLSVSSGPLFRCITQIHNPPIQRLIF